VMKPKPFSELNHFTVPVAIAYSCYLCFLLDPSMSRIETFVTMATKGNPG
jgi:hypothetical protein